MTEMSKKYSFVAGNRQLNENNVVKMMASLREFGNLASMVRCEAAEVGDYKLVDADTGKAVSKEDYINYYVILDGQHRYVAARRLEEQGLFNVEDLQWNTIKVEGKDLALIITEINSRLLSWKGDDFISGAAIKYPSNEILAFANELAHKGVKGKTIIKYLTFATPFKWSEVIKDIHKLDVCNLQRAKMIWDIVSQFSEVVYKSSAIIDYLISNGNITEDLAKIKGLNRHQRGALNSTKAKQLPRVLEEILNKAA